MISENQRKILRYIVFGLVLLSVGIGLKAMYIDLNNPGSIQARELNEYVNYIFVGTIVLSLPLFFEKVSKLSSWDVKFTDASDEERRNMLWQAGKPIIKNVFLILFLAIVTAVILQSVWQISPDTIQAYKDFYSPKSVGLP